MPIRINLLAEAQAAEELRRKDPVKRAIFLGSTCVAIMLVASGVIQWQVMHTNSQAKAFSKQVQAITNDYSAVMDNFNRLQELKLNMRGLDILASERFLNGTLLNTLQQVHVDNVQLIRLRTEQTYTLTDEPKPKPGTAGTTAKALKPATSAEKFTLVLEARDTSPSPGDLVPKFKEALAKNDYFQTLLGTNNELRLANYSPPTLLPELGRSVVQFTLESRVPDKVRLPISSPTRYGTAPAPGKEATKNNSRQEQPKL